MSIILRESVKLRELEGGGAAVRHPARDRSHDRSRTFVSRAAHLETAPMYDGKGNILSNVLETRNPTFKQTLKLISKIF